MKAIAGEWLAGKSLYLPADGKTWTSDYQSYVEMVRYRNHLVIDMVPKPVTVHQYFWADLLESEDPIKDDPSGDSPRGVLCMRVADSQAKISEYLHQFKD